MRQPSDDAFHQLSLRHNKFSIKSEPNNKRLSKNATNLCSKQQEVAKEQTCGKILLISEARQCPLTVVVGDVLRHHVEKSEFHKEGRLAAERRWQAVSKALIFHLVESIIRALKQEAGCKKTEMTLDACGLLPTHSPFTAPFPTSSIRVLPRLHFK